MGDIAVRTLSIARSIMLLKKDKVPEQTHEDIFFNPRESRKIIRFICCLDYVQKPKILNLFNIIYICFVYALQFMVILQGIAWAFIADKIAIKVEAIHYMLVIVIITAYITNELLNYSNVNEAWELIKYAYRNFNGDIINETQKQMHIDNVKMVKRMNITFTFLMSSSSAAYLCFAPIKELIYNDYDKPRTLPIPMYIPFDTTQNPGYVLAVLWEGLTLIYLCGIATCAHQSYLTYMGTLKAELQLLNYSILHMEKRALRKFKKNELTKDIYSNPEFQECLNQCLREDVIHHQILLKFHQMTKSYLGIIFLTFFLVASIILAAAGYLLTRPNSPIDETIKFVAIVGAEMTFIFQLCYSGESVSEESINIFHNIIGGKWYECSQKFKISLNIMQIGNLRPIQLKTNVFNITASLETYNSVVTTSFQYFNLLRNIQTL